MDQVAIYGDKPKRTKQDDEEDEMKRRIAEIYLRESGG
jgi:hypothetical protein